MISSIKHMARANRIIKLAIREDKKQNQRQICKCGKRTITDQKETWEEVGNNIWEVHKCPLCRKCGKNRTKEEIGYLRNICEKCVGKDIEVVLQ